MQCTRAITAIACSMILATAGSTQYGRLVPPAKVAALHASACGGSAPDFATALPKLASLRKWDEYGRSAKARPGDRAWLVSLDGQPAIIDISREGTKQRCSVNAVTVPAGIVSIVQAQQRRRPDRVVPQGRSGEMKVWRISPTRTTSVTVPVAQALARITLETTR